MSTFTVSSLSLEAGATHLEKLFRGDAHSLPLFLREKLTQAQGPDTLLALFPGGELHEEWKYTPLSILRVPWTLGEASYGAEASSLPFSGLPFEAPQEQALEASRALESFPVPASPWERLILTGGTSYGAASLPHNGFYGLSISQQKPQVVAPTFYALHVPTGVEAELFLNTPIDSEGFLILRLHVVLEAGARLTLYHGAPEGGQGSLLLLLSASVQKEACFIFYGLPSRYRWVRTESRITLEGPGAASLLYGAHTARDNEVCDTAIRVFHLAPHTQSNQLFRSIAFKGGRRIFLGRIHVSREGQKTNAYQSHKALLWEEGAEVYSRPQLEIFADDVRCSHGVTTGFLQGDMLFYLRARGLPESVARSLIAEGFLMEALETLPHSFLHTYGRTQIGFAI